MLDTSTARFTASAQALHPGEPSKSVLMVYRSITQPSRPSPAGVSEGAALNEEALDLAAFGGRFVGLALVVPTAGVADAGPEVPPDRIELPNGFQPEGITIGPGPVAYFGSRADGDIYAADLKSGDGAVISEGPGTPSVGLKSDQRGLLYVAGGPSGTARVVNIRTGDDALRTTT